MTLTLYKFGCFTGSLSLLCVGSPALAQGSSELAVATVSAPIPITATSRPFLGAGSKLTETGYVEEEFLLSGEANVYDWTGSGHQLKIVAGPGRYVTRLLVRRPRDAERFSGNIEVTILNASLGADLGAGTDFARMVHQGDVWIGITSKALSANALKQFDPARYKALDWSNPAPVANRCAAPSIIPTYMIGSKEALAAMAKAGLSGSSPATEDGLVWDMLGQLGQLLKSDHRESLLPGFSKPRLFMTGISQSGLYIRTWVAGFHDRYRMPDGAPVYDGYLGVVGPAMTRINQCADDVPLADPRQKLTPPDVPFISISSEGEMWQASYTHQKDSFTSHGGIVTYEVAGASHSAGEIPEIPSDSLMMAPMSDITKAGVKFPDMKGMGSMMPVGTVPNDFVWAPAVRGAYHNLQLWVGSGTRPPLAAQIELDAKLEIRRDADGNALGGLRMPYIDVPTATHHGYLSAGGFGGVTGWRKPFSPEKLKMLYPTHADYVAKFSAAADKSAASRFVSADDAAAMKKGANAASVPGAVVAPTNYTTSASKIGALLDDPAAKAVLEKHFPGLTSNPQIAMAKDMTLASLRQFMPDKFTDKALADTDNDLAKLPPK